MYSRTAWIVGCFVVAISVVGPAAGSHEMEQNWELCTNTGNIYVSDGVVEACTSLVVSNRIGGRELAVVYSDRCKSFVDEGYLDKALQDCNDAVWLDPRLTIAIIQRAGVYAATKDFHRALTDYGRALQLEPNSADAYAGQGEVENALHRYGRAAANFAQATWLGPTNARSWRGLCFSRVMLNEVVRGFADCSESLRLKPNDPETLNLRGIMDLRSGAFTLALRDYDLALKVSPDPADSLYGRGLARLKAGDRSGLIDILDARTVERQVTDKFERLYGIAQDGRVLALPAGQPDGPQPATFGALGIAVQLLSVEIAAALGLRPDRGVLVASTDSRGPAEAIGLRPGDLIVSVNGRQIRNLADFSSIADFPERRRLLFTIVRRRSHLEKIGITIGVSRHARKAR